MPPVLSSARSALLLALLLLSAGRASGDVLIVHMADLHSAVDRYPALVATVETLIEAHPEHAPLILLNGDLFEPHDPIAVRSDGELDWQVLERLRTLAPVVMNVGNHDYDFDDPPEMHARAAELKVTMIGNVGFAGSAAALPPCADVTFSSVTLRIVGITTDQRSTWPERLRETLLLRAPRDWIATLWPTIAESDACVSDGGPGSAPQGPSANGSDDGAAAPLALLLASHAGLAADRTIWPILRMGPRPLAVFGAHDHLELNAYVDGMRYQHAGMGAKRIGYAVIDIDPEIRVATGLLAVARSERIDSAYAAEVATAHERWLTESEREILGSLTKALPLPQAARWAARHLADEQDADAALLNHTSFGRGLPEGPVSRYAFDRFLRFDNALMKADVDGETLRRILQRTRPPGFDPDGDREHGEPLHGFWPDSIDPTRSYRVLTSDWVARPDHQQRYLGTTLDFAPVGGDSIKTRLRRALSEPGHHDTR